MSAGRGDRREARSPGWELLARAATRAAPADESPTCELVAFSLEGDRYALPVERVREIVRLRPITPVPRVPREVLGVISLRGEIVQVVDLRLRMGLESVEPTRASRIVVLHGEDGAVTGILVDAVTEVFRISEHAMRPSSSGESDFVSALCDREGRFVSLMNLDRVLGLVAG